MPSALVQKLTGVRDLKKILETTVKELGESFRAETCQVMLSNPLDPNVTSICEFRASRDEPQELLPTINMPLVLHGRTLGSVSLARYGDISPDEINAMRVILGELGDIIRGAQINDVVQRDTFRETFLVEIGNVMAYSLGIGDALFMVVNILGKVLQASRCLFICTDDTQAGWKCYEFWQQDKIKSCQDYRWPTSDSSIIAQVLLSEVPMIVYEGQVNSYISPVQEELQFVGAKSLLGVPLRTADATHGCVILQQCDYRRAWTRGEIDMAQNVADKVAEALLKLPAEKRAREPIMQLHQRIVTQPGEEGKAPDSVSVRNALKGTFGQQVIQTARKTSAPPPPPPAPKAAPIPPTPPAASKATAAPATAASWPQKVSDVDTAVKMPTVPSDAALNPQAPAAQGAGAWGAPPGAPSITPVQSKSLEQGAGQASPDGAGSGAGFGKLLNRGAQDEAAVQPPVAPTPGPNDTITTLEAVAGVPQPGTVPGGTAAEAAAAAAAASAETPAAEPATKSSLDSISAPKTPAAPGGWGNLDSIPTPKAPPTQTGGWGDLDAIAAPGGATSGAPVDRKAGGLSSMMGGKARASSTSSKPFSKSRGAAAPEPAATPAAPSPEPVDEATAVANAEAKLKAALDKNTIDETADFIFATPGLDPRMAGRVSSWIQEIEEKDKYVGGHARQVAELSVAIAKEAMMSAEEIDLVRLAGLLHDLGKRACAPEVLQKKDEELSDPELIVMMKHPIDGSELLESFPDLKHIAEIVRAHHEEFDGNGYPQGLKGDQIPKAARVVGLANSYHSMISNKTYGPGMDATKAQEELVKGAGKQWDPALVQALILAIMSKKVPAVL